MARIDFDATGIDPHMAFEPIPAGKYIAFIKDSDVKATKAGTGHYLQLTWEVAEGPHKGRLIFDRINVHNPNKTAEEIGQRQLAAICQAAGRMQVADSAELHHIPMRIKVVIKQDDQKYEPANEVKGYESASAAASPAAAPAAPAAASQAAATPPWLRKSA